MAAHLYFIAGIGLCAFGFWFVGLGLMAIGLFVPFD